MTVFMAWTSTPVPGALEGPWEEVRAASTSLTLISSSESLSRVYHALKWALPADSALVVAAVAQVPKLRGLPPGTLNWLRDRMH